MSEETTRERDVGLDARSVARDRHDLHTRLSALREFWMPQDVEQLR